MHSLDIAELSAAVEAKYGTDESPVDVFLQSLNMVKTVSEIIGYGSFSPESVNAMTAKLADLLIVCFRLNNDRPPENRIVLPREDTIIMSQNATDWAMLALGYGRMFSGTPRSAARSYTRDLVNFIDDTAIMYGVTFGHIMGKALRSIEE